MKNIVIFGAPGSGKGTQSDLLVKKYGFKHISTGDVLRAEIKNGTSLGQTAKSYIDKGQLIPDELMIDILANVYDSLCPCDGVIFEVDVMIELSVPDEMLMERLINRGKTSGRADDNEETIRKRLDVYKNQTAPLIEWYKTDGKHRAVKGHGALEEITDALSEVIDNL